MTAILAITGIFLLFLFLFAFNASDVDAMDILEQKQINHKRGLIIRILIGALVYALTCIAWVIAYRFYRVGSIWPVLLLIPMGWAWWTAWFRFLLNNMRGLDWRYVSPSNWYDWQWLNASFSGELRPSRNNVVHFSQLSNWPAYRKLSNRAGLYAYTFEAIVFASSAIALLCST